MYRILEKQSLTENTDMMVIEAQHIAHKARAGQFIIVRKDEYSERIPLTIADYDTQRGTITIIFQKVGMSTNQLAEMQAGDLIRNVVGPLGKFTPIENLAGWCWWLAVWALHRSFRSRVLFMKPATTSR